MNQHEHKHSAGHHHHHAKPWWQKLHTDWRAWLVVGLMLAAMAVYVLSFDERFRFWEGGGEVEPPMPAAGGE